MEDKKLVSSVRVRNGRGQASKASGRFRKVQRKPGQCSRYIEVIREDMELNGHIFVGGYESCV